MTDQATLSHFESQVNREFHVLLDNSVVYSLVLTEATGLAPGHPGRTRDPFQLKFRGPGPGFLPQATYQLRNDALGQLSLFLVPIGRDGDGFIYQAVFN